MSTEITSQTGSNTNAVRAICMIEGAYPGYKSYCLNATLQWGVQPGFAQVVVPLNALDGGPAVPGKAIAGNRHSMTERISDGDLAIITAQLDGGENSNDANVCVLSGTKQSSP